MTRVEILDEAERDLVDGAHFYEAQDVGLGQYFLDSLFSDIDSLQLYAGIHRVQFGYHRLLSKRFPYAVYYRVEGSVAQVWAVLDCRQDPEKIVSRLTQDRL
jgi:plasmid stabilization system protein ParE